MPPHIKVYVNGQEISALDGLDTTLKDGDEVTIMPGDGRRRPGADGTLTPEQRERYSRHIVLPQWGEEGQRKLMAAKVLVVGAGGLGSPVLFYLAGAGVGTLGVVEFDVVEISNLPRQLLHHMHDLGRSKAHSAQQSAGRQQPGCERRRSTRRCLTAENALEIIRGYDVVVAAVDNLARATWSTTPASCWASRWSRQACSPTRGNARCSCPARAAIAACIRRRRRRA